jgi:predicted O-methyltransferase YrrM
MPLLRTYDPAMGKIVVTLRAAYLDRLSRWSDIQEYMPFLHEQARSRPRCRVLELGARRANSTLAFLAGAAESGGHVWSCDIEDVRRYPDGIGPFGRSPRWTFVHGDDLDPDVQGNLPAEVDVLFIDTSHEYAATVGECRAFFPRVAPGGIALFHDTKLMGWPGYEWDGDFPPVWQALDDYCAEAGLTWENLAGKYGMGVIRVDGEPAAP